MTLFCQRFKNQSLLPGPPKGVQAIIKALFLYRSPQTYSASQALPQDICKTEPERLPPPSISQAQKPEGRKNPKATPEALKPALKEPATLKGKA